MLITLKVVTGPHKGLSFQFSNHDTFLVGRSKHAHFQLPAKDKYFSRIHFMIEVNPPQCRLVDMGSHNGTYVNGSKVLSVDLKEGDQIRAGHTVLAVHVEREADDMFDSVDTVMGVPSPIPVLPAVSGYTPVRQLGQAALGQMFQAATSDGRLVAVKIVQPQAAGSPAQVQEFLRTSRALVALAHPAIVPLRDLGFLKDFFYFVWDFVPGKNAAELLEAEAPLAVKRVVRWMHQLLPALEYAHAKGIVYRDLRPANIRIREGEANESALWTNFGLSRLYSASPFAGLTMTGNIAETAAFLPPETITDYQAPTPLGDQYAVAANLYYLLTKEHIYRLPKNTNRRFSILLKEQVIPIQERRQDIPDDLAQVIHKALSRQPANRFASVAEFHKALIQAVA